MIVVVVVAHSLWGKEFQGLEEKLIVSLQTENELLKKKKKTTGTPDLFGEDKKVSIQISKPGRLERVFIAKNVSNMD